MTDNEAKKILLENRPDRPRNTSGRRLQVAIDIAIKALQERIDANEALEKMLEQMEREYDKKIGI